MLGVRESDGKKGMGIEGKSILIEQGYIERRFRELENEKPGKGFVMTIYRRRAASSWASLEKSLARRKAGLEKVIARHALYEYAEEDVRGFDAAELEDFDLSTHISLALPSDPQEAARERGDPRTKPAPRAADRQRD